MNQSWQEIAHNLSGMDKTEPSADGSIPPLGTVMRRTADGVRGVVVEWASQREVVDGVRTGNKSVLITIESDAGVQRIWCERLMAEWVRDAN